MVIYVWVSLGFLVVSVTLNPNFGVNLFVWNPNPNPNFVFFVFCVLKIDWLSWSVTFGSSLASGICRSWFVKVWGM